MSIINTLSKIDWIAGNTVIQFTYTDPALLSVDAIVEEQDTNLLLGKSLVTRETVESFPALVKKMEQQIVERPGHVIVTHSIPKRFIAIVYDIEHDPICEMTWIEDTLKKIFHYCAQYKIVKLAMPLLGTSYGKIDGEIIMRILQNMLINKRHPCLKKILIYKLI